jgi:1-deoxy-D-xylulose-5-phosphate synthase
VAILSNGTTLDEALVATDEIEDSDPTPGGVMVADTGYMKPWDVDLDRQLVEEHWVIVTSEEGSIVRFGDYVLHFLSLDGLLDDGDFKSKRMVIPDT